MHKKREILFLLTDEIFFIILKKKFKESTSLNIYFCICFIAKMRGFIAKMREKERKVKKKKSIFGVKKVRLEAKSLCATPSISAWKINISLTFNYPNGVWERFFFTVQEVRYKK